MYVELSTCVLFALSNAQARECRPRSFRLSLYRPAPAKPRGDVALVHFDAVRPGSVWPAAQPIPLFPSEALTRRIRPPELASPRRDECGPARRETPGFSWSAPMAPNPRPKPGPKRPRVARPRGPHKSMSYEILHHHQLYLHSVSYIQKRTYI